MIRRIAWVLGLSVVVLSLASCKKPKPGDSCKTDGKQICADKSNSIVCVDSKWEALPCRGTMGCTTTAGDVDCDNDGYNAGGFCDPASDDFECSADKKAMVKCEGKHWKLQDKCLGQNGCVSSAKEVKCDDSISELAASCSHENAAACTTDGKAILKCSGGAMVADQFCRGAHGCRKQFDKIECDDTLAQVGDPCDTDGDISCSVDKKALLTCKSSKMAQTKTCKGGCTVIIDKIDCN